MELFSTGVLRGVLINASMMQQGYHIILVGFRCFEPWDRPVAEIYAWM